MGWRIVYMEPGSWESLGIPRSQGRPRLRVNGCSGIPFTQVRKQIKKCWLQIKNRPSRSTFPVKLWQVFYLAPTGAGVFGVTSRYPGMISWQLFRPLWPQFPWGSYFAPPSPYIQPDHSGHDWVHSGALPSQVPTLIGAALDFRWRRTLVKKHSVDKEKRQRKKTGHQASAQTKVWGYVCPANRELINYLLHWPSSAGIGNVLTFSGDRRL